MLHDDRINSAYSSVSDDAMLTAHAAIKLVFPAVPNTDERSATATILCRDLILIINRFSQEGI